MKVPVLHKIEWTHFTTLSGTTLPLTLTYEHFGRELHSAPVVLIISWIYEMTTEGLRKTDSVDREKSISIKRNS